MLGAIILQVILIFLNAIFASAEIAVISTSETKLEKLAEEGNKKARTLLKLKGNSSKFLSTIQVAITLAGFLGSAYAADNFAAPLVGLLTGLGVAVSTEVLTSVCVFAITLILSYFSIVFGELVPKKIAMKHPERMAFLLSGLLLFVSRAFAPFVWILTKSTNATLRLFRIDPNDEGEEVTEDEIRMMLDSGSEHGTIDEMENEMIQNIFEFDDISIAEACTHRRDVLFLYKDDGIEEWKKIIASTRHKYYPICGENTDDIIGVLNASKFFRETFSDAECAICAASEKPFFVPEAMKADVLFTKMKESRNHFAIVLDEYGGTGGVITMHDLLELLVGDIAEKDDAIAAVEIEKLDSTRYRVTGSASLSDVCEELHIHIESEDVDTFGGYIISLLGFIPDDGTSHTIETEELLIQTETINDHRVESAIVTLTQGSAPHAA